MYTKTHATLSVFDFEFVIIHMYWLLVDGLYKEDYEGHSETNAMPTIP